MDLKINKSNKGKHISRKRRQTSADINYEAPDGGWGWLVAVGFGFTIISIMPMYEQFGLVFVDKYKTLGFTHSKTTTIFNINSALTTCAGLLNGPIFRRFSFRQVALFSNTLAALSLFILTWCTSFWSNLIFYGILYGFAIGLMLSANLYALTTYFSSKRNIAMGLAWGIAGLSSITVPYVLTLTLSLYGSAGTLLIFSAFSANGIACSFLLQPVEWHTQYILDEENIIETKTLCNSTQSNSSFLLEQNNDIKAKETMEEELYSCGIEKNENVNVASTFMKKRWNQFVVFFELDILYDLSYLNLMLGMTCIFFCEINYIFLLPVILKEFKFDNYKIVTYLFVVGIVDVITRFLIPFIATKINCHIRVYFLIGVLMNTIGRVVLMHTRDFKVSLFVAVISGIGKAFFVVNLMLLISNHVPLNKFPAANGIYLTTCGIFFIVIGPIVGWIADITNSVIAVHILNVFFYIAAISWMIEYIQKKKL